jgi:hypothetical protein
MSDRTADDQLNLINSNLAKQQVHTAVAQRIAIASQMAYNKQIASAYAWSASGKSLMLIHTEVDEGRPLDRGEHAPCMAHRPHQRFPHTRLREQHPLDRGSMLGSMQVQVVLPWLGKRYPRRRCSPLGMGLFQPPDTVCGRS